MSTQPDSDTRQAAHRTGQAILVAGWAAVALVFFLVAVLGGGK